VQWSGIQTALEQSQSDVLALLDCCHAGTAYNDEGNGTTELIAACAYNSATNGVPSYSLAKELAAELRELSTIPSFSIGNLYDNIFSRVRGQMTEEGLEHQSPVYLPLTQENPKSPRSIRLAVHKQGWEPTMPNRLASDDVHSPQSDAFGITGTNGDHNDLAFKRSSVASVGPTPRMAFAIRLTEDFRVGDLSQNLFSEWLRNIPPSVQEVKIEAGFHSYSSLLVISVPVCMSIYMPKDPAVVSLGPITSFNQVLTRVPIPKDLPTPNPETWTTWGSPGNGISGLDAGANAHEIVTGVNGDGNSKVSELRFRKNAHLIPPKVTKVTRPTLDKAYSSQYSAASNLTESPVETNGTNGVRPTTSVPETPETPHPTHTHSYQGRKGHHQHHSSTDYIDDPDLKEYPRISKPVELLRSSYDCVVIGSGYGGAVAASRMARAGQRVCLLERGKERWPGEYPVGFLEAMKQFHVSGEFAPGFLKGAMVEGGDPTGLYHLIVGKGQNAFVGNGLGGTSLLNANVYLEADDATMKMDCWPEELQGHDKLKKYYKRAAKVLEPQPYPKDFPELKKLNVLEKQAKALGMHEKFYRVPQTTKFQAGPNSCGVQMQSSTGTGQDATGVNDGSKSSTLVNYLSDAWNWGAEMFCECEVRYIKKHPTEEGYLIFFAWHGSKRGAFKTNLYEDLMWVHAREYVFLGAGAIGTTEILLRSKKLGLSMSDKVGKGMSGNGDILAFGYNTDEVVNAIGKEYTDYNPTGPTITGVIDCRDDQENPIDGYVIEEGAVPKALAPLFQTMLELMPGNQIPKGEGLFSKVKHAFAQQGSRFLGPYFKKGSIERTQVYLIMSHDSNQAIMTMKDDKPILEFLGVGRSKHVEWLNDLLRQATEAVGGHFVQSPFYACLGQQEITVHPIGGACMSKDGRADNGVTNHYGELLNGTADEIHEGLVVTDASVIPTALGVNPFATITALAERSVEHAALRIDRRIDFKTKNDILDFRKEPHQYAEDMRQLDRQDTIRIAEARELVNETQASKANGFGFSEVMSGYIHIGGEDEVLGDKLEDYETAAKTARGLCEEARFFLSVQAWDTDISKLRVSCWMRIY
jgi:choline dehydrogenase-like flavoprotein